MSSMLDTSKTTAEAEANNVTPAKEASVGADVCASIVRQVEFYFSDANLPTDKFLLKQVQQGQQGFVPVKLIAQFKRVKSLSKDVDVITAALKGSADLVVSPDNLYVRRLKPLPNVNEHDIKKRTVLVTQIPGVPSIESVTDLFSRYGAVKLVRICPPGSTEKLPQWLTVANPSVQAAAASNQLFALVELVTEDSAKRAVADSGYSGMQVRHLLFDQEQQPAARGHHHQPPQQQQPPLEQQQQQQAPNGGAGRGSNHRRNRSGFQPGVPPAALDLMRSDMARMQLRSSPSGPLPYHYHHHHMDAQQHHQHPQFHHHPHHLNHPHHHQPRAPINAPPARGPGTLPAHDHRRVNQRQAPYTHDARLRALHTAEALPSYLPHAGPPASLDIPPRGPPSAHPPNHQRNLLLRSQQAPYHTQGPPNAAPLPPSSNAAPHRIDPQQQQGRVRDRPASDRNLGHHQGPANGNATGAADKAGGADRNGNGNGGDNRAVSVGRRAPHFVVDLDYQPAESGRRATSRRHRGRNPMDASGSSGDTSAASSPMAPGSGGAGAPQQQAQQGQAPAPAQQQQQQLLQTTPPPQQQQGQRGGGKNSGRQGNAAANGVGGSAPMRHGGHNPLFTSPAAVGGGGHHHQHQHQQPALMQQAAARMQGLQTQAPGGQDLRQFIALFESFVQQQLGTPGGGAAAAAAPGAVPAAGALGGGLAPPASPPHGASASTGGSAPPVSPVQQGRAPTYLPIHPATPPASLPGAPTPGGTGGKQKKSKSKAAKALLPDGASPDLHHFLMQQQQQQAGGGGGGGVPNGLSNGSATTPLQGGGGGGNRGPQQGQQGQQQGRKAKGQQQGTPAQGGRGKGPRDANGNALPNPGQDGAGSNGQDGAGSGGEGGSSNANGNNANANNGEGMGKKRTKKDYASWAAATAEFRAQSSAAYAGQEGGGAAGGGGGGAGGAVGTPPQAPAPIKEAVAVIGKPRVPDGTRGFGMGRGRALAPPVV